MVFDFGQLRHPAKIHSKVLNSKQRSARIVSQFE